MEGAINQVGLSVDTLGHYNAEFMKIKKGQEKTESHNSYQEKT